MIRRTGLAILVLFACVLGAAVAPPQLFACSLIAIDPAERLETFARHSTAVVVGEVTRDERSESGFRSTIRVVSILAGDAPGEFAIDGLGMPIDCGSGPRMTGGERFLLFMTDEPGVGAAGDPGWQLAALGQGLYIVEAGEAFYYGEFNDPRQRERVGSAEALLREVAEVLDSDPAEVEQAIAFANGAEAPPRVAVEESNPVTVWGSVGVALIAVGVLAGWYVRGRSRRRA